MTCYLMEGGGIACAIGRISPRSDKPEPHTNSDTHFATRFKNVSTEGYYSHNIPINGLPPTAEPQTQPIEDCLSSQTAEEFKTKLKTFIEELS